MDISEIYLLTAFVCSACDGDIEPKEIALVKEWSDKSNLFGDIDVEAKLNDYVEAKLNDYVEAINKYGNHFIREFLLLLENENFTNEQLEIIRIAIDIIEANGIIEYSEVKFFKKLRSCLSINDNAILEVMPDKEEYLLPDIKADYVFDKDIKFAEIILNAKNS